MAAWLVRRKRLPVLGRGTTGGGLTVIFSEFSGPSSSGFSGLLSCCPDGTVGLRLWLVLTSAKGSMGVAMRESATGDGDDHRPGRGSELLRRRFPCHASSSSSSICVVSLPGLRFLARNAVALSSAAGRRYDCWELWFGSSPLLPNEETDERREMRILGRRERDGARDLGVYAVGVNVLLSGVGDEAPFGRSSGPPTGSM